MPETLVTRRSIYSWVLGGNAKYQILLLGLVLATVAARVFPLEMQKRIVNQAIGMGDLNKLFFYSALFFASTFLAQVLKYAINLIQGHIGQSALALLREQLFEHLVRLPLSFFRRTSPGSVISSMVTELSGFGDFAGQSISLPLVNILTFLAFGGYMFYQSPLLAAISVSIYPIDALILPRIQKRFNRVNRERAAQQREMSGMIGEAVSGIQELHGNAAYNLEAGKFSRMARKMYRTAFRLNALKWGSKFANNFFQGLGPLILFLVGGYLAIRGRFDLGSLVAFLSAYEKLYDPWKELLDFYQLFQDSRLRYGQVMEQFDALPEYAMAPEGREPPAFTGKVDIQDLSYLVGGNIRILDRISFSLKPGEHLALVGFSGSGKSPLALCIGQLYA